MSVLGSQLTAVAVAFQVYQLSHSSFDVGLVSLIQLFPLLVCSLLGGAVIDAVDRRRLLIVVELAMAVSSACLALNSDLGPQRWPLFVFPAISAGLTGIDTPTRNAMIPSLVGPTLLTEATAMFQALIQIGAVVGPAAAGLLLAGAGSRYIYWLDVASFVISVAAAAMVTTRPAVGSTGRPGLRSVVDGLRYARRHEPLRGSYLIDMSAMVFGMPRALFPALALNVFGGGAGVLGFLYAAPGAGALIGALTTGWVGRIRRQGRAVVIAVLVWGTTILLFGLVRSLPIAIVLLAAAGWADMISALFRNTILQFTVPDQMRGRMLGVKMAVVQGGPRVGDLESGAVAAGFGTEASVVSGGLLCVLTALMVAARLRGFREVVIDPTGTNVPTETNVPIEATAQVTTETADPVAP